MGHLIAVLHNLVWITFVYFVGDRERRYARVHDVLDQFVITQRKQFFQN